MCFGNYTLPSVIRPVWPLSVYSQSAIMKIKLFFSSLVSPHQFLLLFGGSEKKGENNLVKVRGRTQSSEKSKFKLSKVFPNDFMVLNWKIAKPKLLYNYFFLHHRMSIDVEIGFIRWARNKIFHFHDEFTAFFFFAFDSTLFAISFSCGEWALTRPFHHKN